MPSKQAIDRRPAIGLILLLLVFLAPLQVYGSIVTVVIELDQPLLRQLLVKQLFGTPLQSTEILNDPYGCSRVVIANPQVVSKPPGIEIITEIKAQLGVAVFGDCRNLLQWEGDAGFLGRPVVESDARSLRFEPIDGWLVSADGTKVTGGKIWELTRSHIQAQFSRFTLNLKSSIETLGMVLTDVLPHLSIQQLQTTIDSLRLSEVQVSENGIDVSLSIQVEEAVELPQPEAVLSEEELRHWDSRWQMMDALFTHAVKYFSTVTDSRELHTTLMDILLDSRYRLRDALSATADRPNDPVRRWFLESWQRLSPVIRGISLEQSGQEPLLWVSLLTATDALYALDQLGATIGLEISAEGLRRLARLIDANAGVDPLVYDQAVDAELRQLFQLQVAPESDKPSGSRFDFRLIRSAWAEESTALLDRWVPSEDELPNYLSLVADLLKKSAEEATKKTQFDKPIDDLFQKLILATAWQESCWRQYVIVKKKIEPLRSSTGDVGLMQVNERIWRGFYNIQKLRWDIAYNVRAGVEILINYLVKYALQQGEHNRSGGIDNLARASYSAYNGGPGQVTRYRNSNAASTHKKIDAAFWEKYQQVSAGDELNVARCLGLETNVPKKNRPTSKSVDKSFKGNQPDTTVKDAGVRWVQAQQKSRYTLQLAVFSQHEFARKFIEQLTLTGPVSIYPMQKNSTTQFAVLYGSYASRNAADHRKRQLRHLKPWVRQFKDIRKAGEG